MSPVFEILTGSALYFKNTPCSGRRRKYRPAAKSKLCVMARFHTKMRSRVCSTRVPSPPHVDGIDEYVDLLRGELSEII